MKIEQAAMLLNLAKHAMLDVEGVYSIQTTLMGKSEFIVHVTKDVFNSIDGDITVAYEPEGILYARLDKKVNGITFFMLMEGKEFDQLYPKK